MQGKVFNRFLLEPFILPEGLQHPPPSLISNEKDNDDQIAAYQLAAIIGIGNRHKNKSQSSNVSSALIHRESESDNENMRNLDESFISEEETVHSEDVRNSFG